MDNQLSLKLSDESENFLSNMDEIKRSAVISDCRKYRYALSRVWDENKKSVMFIMLNPSTADAEKDDPTIRRCIGFAQEWGYGGLHVVNLFAFRATDPRELLSSYSIEGSENQKWIKEISSLSDLIVCAWGNSPIVNKLQKKFGQSWKPLLCIEKPLHYLQLSNDGTPKHPLYLPKKLTPISFDVSGISLIKKIK